ncbi:hypothetical protein ACLOJK_036528, partial [Asimina triloba]
RKIMIVRVSEKHRKDVLDVGNIGNIGKIGKKHRKDVLDVGNIGNIGKIGKKHRKDVLDVDFWHGYDGLVLVKMEDTNIQPGYIGHQHLNDGLMPDVQ